MFNCVCIFQFDPAHPPSQRPMSIEPPGYIAPENKPSIKDVRYSTSYASFTCFC